MPCYRKIFCLFLIGVLLISVLAGCQAGKPPLPANLSPLLATTFTLPGTNSTASVPTTTEILPVQAPTTLPTVQTEPPTTAPSEPPVTEPTEPPVTKPPATKPPLPRPTETEPPETDPPETKPTEPSTTGSTKPPATEPDPTLPKIPSSNIPKLRAKNAFIFDTRTSHFLYNSAATSTKVYPASITKLFTSYVALQYLHVDEKVTVGKEVYFVASDASIAGFQEGDVVTVSDLIYGALLPSGCDASYILAAAAGREILQNKNASAKDAVNAFLSACNQKAKNLGMTGTNIANPDGYHNSNHYFSLQALSVVGNLALKSKVLSKVCATASVTITYKNSSGSSRTATFKNTNMLIQTKSEYYHDLAVGLKTGTTGAAGACLLAAYRVPGGYILVGVLGCSSNESRFSDANALFEASLPYL